MASKQILENPGVKMLSAAQRNRLEVAISDACPNGAANCRGPMVTLSGNE